MKAFDDVLRVVRRHKTFLVTCHCNPDSDAVTSVLAMVLALKKMKKSAVVLNEDHLPDWLTFLPKAGLFKRACGVKPFDYGAAIVLDCGDLERIGGVKKLLIKTKPTINIDHHVTNDRFGSVNCVVPRASSTCEILFDLFKQAKVRLDKDMALLLYAGIMTDTGSFKYENTSAHTHTIAGELMAFGLKVPLLHEKLYPGIPVADMKHFSKLIYEAELVLGGRVYCASIPKRTADLFSKGFDLKEKVFTFLRNVKGIEAVMILNEVNSGMTRVNLRSQGKMDVAVLAQQFNGGGHRKAAGCKVYADLLTARKRILAACAKQLKAL